MLILFDVRRYQPDLKALARQARTERNGRVVRVSDADWPAARKRIVALDALGLVPGPTAFPQQAAAQQGTRHDS